MWAPERKEKINELLKQNGKVYTQDLAQCLQVSCETIRRDLKEMEESRVLKRVHGGAIIVASVTVSEPKFNERLQRYAESKSAIARYACNLITPGSTLFIDAGTTTLAFARELAMIGHVRVITNGIRIAEVFSAESNCEVLLLGGKPHNDVPGTYGEMTIASINRFLADYAIISPVGFHMLYGAMDYELHEAEVARTMMKRSHGCIMLCHAEKIGNESRVAICRPEEIDHLVTDEIAMSGMTLPHGQVHYAPIDSLRVRSVETDSESIK